MTLFEQSFDSAIHDILSAINGRRLGPYLDGIFMELIYQAGISSHICPRIRTAWLLEGDANFIKLDAPHQEWGNFIFL